VRCKAAEPQCTLLQHSSTNTNTQLQTHARSLSHNVQPQSRRASEHGPESWRPGRPSRAPGCVFPSAASSTRPHARWQAQSRAHGLPPTCSRWQRAAAERAKATRACRRWATAPARARQRSRGANAGAQRRPR
jgi:hypothetical protein